MRPRFLIAIAFALALIAPPLVAQQLLPDRFGSWLASAPPPTQELRSDADRDAILKESGKIRSESRTYLSSNSELYVKLTEFRDPSGAYEWYTNLLESGMTPSDLGQVSAVNRDRAVILVGNLVLGVGPLKYASPADLRAVVEKLALRASRTPLPALPNYLPAKTRVQGTERYALGPAALRAAAEALGRPAFSSLADAIGFSSGAEAMLSRYQKGRVDAVVLLIEYPTPQSAARFQKHIEQAIATLPQAAETAIRRKGSLLSLVLQPPSHEYAEALLDGVSFETNVTWNESSHALTDPPWPVIVVNTMVGTGIFLVAAIVFGIAFGGVRVVTKIFLPGKVFDRAQNMEILQLGINSKPIDARDFYSSIGF